MLDVEYPAVGVGSPSRIKMLDLFSGIGGFALAAKWTWGDLLDIVGFCEIEKYAQKVLQKNFPGVPIYDDITKLNGNDFKDIDLLTGGFPCQDISIAGKGEGITGKRSGLWTEMHRIISEVRPRYALIENVPMLIHRGLERVLSDLTEIGYDTEWQIVGADDVGAWHRRKRIWIVAYSGDSTNTTIERQEKKENRISKEYRQKRRSGMSARTSINGEVPSEDVAYSNGTRSESKLRETISWKQNKKISNSKSGGKSTGRNSIFSEFKDEKYVPDTDRKRSQRMESESQESQRSNKQTGFQSRTRKRNWWAIEPELGRVANGIPSRVDRLKGLGNAIVPQVAQLIMERIKYLI